MQLSVGDDIPLQIFVPDRTTDNLVKATVISRRPSHIVAENVTLLPIDDEDGLYALDLESMPDAEFIEIVYEVFDSSGDTKLFAASEVIERRSNPFDSFPIVGIVAEESLIAQIIPLE